MDSTTIKPNRFDLPFLGLGLGLRHVHFQYILEQWPKVDWFEIISENFMFSGGRPRHILRQIAERYPIVMHGVSLSIGSTDPLNKEYLKKLKSLEEEIQPVWISDHLCWTGVLGVNTHDLLPLPLTHETLEHVASRIQYIQEFMGRPLILENPSTYLEFTDSEIPEPEFLGLLVQQTGCGLLLDVNNTYVSCFNSGNDPEEYIHKLPHDAIVQIHIAGHQHRGTHIVDTHDREVSDQVWALYQLTWSLTGGVSTLLEWDGNIPDFQHCVDELNKAKKYMNGEMNKVMDEVMPSGKISQSTPVDFMLPLMTDEYYKIK